MKKIKILIVDDHALFRDGINALLALVSNVEVVGEATNGKEALEMVETLSPDIVLMDLAMPFMDGLEATRRICKKIAHTTKVLVLTQHDEMERAVPVIRAGARGIVTKMTAFSELASAIYAVHNGESYLSPSAAAALVDSFQLQDSLDEDVDQYQQLTNREREVLKLIAEGYTSREIGEMLFISSKTVEWHKYRMMNKLNLRNKAEVIKFALHRRIIT